MMNSGRALLDPEKDELGRKRLAIHLATALLDYRHVDSLVVAVYGKWGTGKSTLLNFIERALGSSPTDDRPIIVRFDPWNYSNQTELVSQFFDNLSVALQRPDLGKKYHRASSLLQTLSRRAKSLEGVPHVGVIVKGLNFGVNTFARGLEQEADDARDLDSIKSDISRTLAQNNKKVVIILDDLDRISAAEIRQMFQLVKALADFSNVIYLLAFDRTVVVPALQKVQEGDGNMYLEKIVNVPIELPLITGSQIRRLLIDRLNVMAARHESYDWGSTNRHLLEILEYLYPLFTTIRALDRLVNILFFSEGLIEDEVEYADFIAVSSLQALNLGIYHFVRDNESLFVHSEIRALTSPSGQDARDQATIEEALNTNCQPRDRENVKQLLLELFPRVRDLYGGGTSRPSGEERSVWERTRRICASPEIFQTYFQLDISETGFSAKRMNSILDNLGSFSTTFSELIGEHRAIPFLEELRNYYDDSRVLEATEDIVGVLFDKGDAFPNDMTQFPIKLDGPLLLLQIVHQLVRRIESEEERFACLSKAIENAHDSLYTSVHSISVEDQVAGRYNLGGSGDKKKLLVSESHLDELERMCRSHIEMWASDGRLASHEQLGHILYRWANWGGGTALAAFILEDLTDSQFVKLFATIGLGTAQARMAERPVLYEAQVTPLAPISNVRDRLRAIHSDAERRASLSDELRRSLDSLIVVPDEASDKAREDAFTEL